MRFKKFYQINELFNNWTYYVPKDKEYMLFDFYALSLVYPDKLDDINMKIAFKEAKEKIATALVEDFKYALSYALASEFRHIGGASPTEVQLDTGYNYIKDAYFDHFKNMGEKKFGDQYYKLMNKSRGGFWTRDDSFKVINKMKLPPSKLAKIYKKSFVSSFFDRYLGPGFGGKPWAMIADAWERLYSTKGVNNQMVLIDHIYDLQHNNDTVFDKVKKYYKKTPSGFKGLSWLKIALNFKRDIKDPFALYDKISSGLQDPFAYVMKMQNGITLQRFKETTTPTLEPGDKVKVKKEIKDLTIGDVYYHTSVLYKPMLKFAGKYVTISDIREVSILGRKEPAIVYNIKELGITSGYKWPIQWFDLTTIKKKKRK